MKNSKNTWLRAALGLTLVLGIGYYAVNASEKAEALKIKKDTEAKLVAPVYKWYQLVETTNSTPAGQTLASLTPMSSPPPANDAFNCAQNSTAAKYCAVVIEFPEGTLDFNLSETNLQNAIDNHSTTISVASGNTAVDVDGDGYSRKP